MPLDDEVSNESAIRRLLAMYCQFADDFRIDEWIELFTKDAELIIADRVGRTGLECIRNRSKARRQSMRVERVADLASILRGAEDSGASEDRQMSGDSRDVDAATGRGLGDGQWATACGEMCDECNPCRIAQRAKKLGIELVLEGADTGGGKIGGFGHDWLIVYLRKYANISLHAGRQRDRSPGNRL